MATREEMKAAVCAAIDRSQDEIIAFAEDIYHHPELGFKETRTAGRVADVLREMGVPHRAGLALTGVKGELATGQPGPTVAVMGELDSLRVPDHPAADPSTGAAHACGHHMQLAAMLGAGMGLLRSGVLPQMAGRVVLFAVPSEEGVEVEWRLSLVREGKLEFVTGKTELLRLGELDDVDMAMMVHATSRADDGMAGIHASSNGLVRKLIQFQGKAAHAGAAPWQGVNALMAANVALSAIQAQRETFRDEDSIRVHPIITRGGTLVNIIPDDVRMETSVRGRSAEAIRDAAGKIDRALRAGAVAMGAKVRIQTIPGYLPLRNNADLGAIFKQNMLSMIPADQFKEGGHLGGSTDMGDITHVMPAIHPMIGGFSGTGHGNDFLAVDPVLSYVKSAKAMAMTVVDLLAEGAAEARRVMAAFKPLMSKSEYLAYQRSMKSEESFDGASVGPNR